MTLGQEQTAQHQTKRTRQSRNEFDGGSDEKNSGTPTFETSWSSATK